MARAKTVGWLEIVLGFLVLVAPFVTTGNALQWTEVVLGALVLIVGAWALGIKEHEMSMK
ncbi:MAG: hypothetical protein ACE5PM_04920 [Candidatus Hydrothermarchaeales archaeon]